MRGRVNAIYYVRATAVPVTSRALPDGVVHECQRKLILRTLKNNWEDEESGENATWLSNAWTLEMDRVFVCWNFSFFFADLLLRNCLKFLVKELLYCNRWITLFNEIHYSIIGDIEFHFVALCTEVDTKFW